jgi:hypothetical protein
MNLRGYGQNHEHSLIIHLFSGSYTRHDILPWDDDVDLWISIGDRNYLHTVIHKELSFEPYNISIKRLRNKRNYDKIFFSWCPSVGVSEWTFPCVDLFYYDQNSTHIMHTGLTNGCPERLQDIFPLVLRPLGPLWLYGPREPMAHFESRKMVRIEIDCFVHAYSHKYERVIRNGPLHAKCSDLNHVYPYVERVCSSNQCTESLRLLNNTIIHTIVYNYSYRTLSYAELNTSYNAC